MCQQRWNPGIEATRAVIEGLDCQARGRTSGIGTAAFEQGGFILDGGNRFGPPGGKQDFRPSAASRRRFSEDWRILLVTPDIGAGAHGGQEKAIFRTHCPVPLREVRELCHEVLMRMIPGLVEHDLDLFGSAVNWVQNLGFKKVGPCSTPSSRRSLRKWCRLAPPGGPEFVRADGLRCWGFRHGGVVQAAKEILGDHGGRCFLRKRGTAGQGCGQGDGRPDRIIKIGQKSGIFPARGGRNRLWFYVV